MDLSINKVKNSVLRQKRLYLFLVTLVVISLIGGILFYFVINSEDKKLVYDTLTAFFDGIKNGQGINYFGSLFNSLSTGLLYVIIIWLLGISIIGLPIVIITITLKCFTIGFSISSIIAIYGPKGIIGALAYIFPHQIIFLFLLIFLGFYSISFSIKLFKHLFLKDNINFKLAMKRYAKVLLISIIITVISSILEVFLSTYLIKLFLLIV